MRKLNNSCRRARKTAAQIFASIVAIALSNSPGSAQIAVSDNASPAEADARSTYIPELRRGDDYVHVTVSGQINKGYLSYDDGVKRQDYFLVDNDNSSTRARIEGYIRANEELAIGTMIEAQWNPYSTSRVNQLNRNMVDWDSIALRKGEVWFDHSRYGRLWLGQGSMASDGSAEVDLSGTGVIGYSGIADLAGGQLFRLAGTGVLSTVSVRSAFRNLDGAGRLLRARYDTPDLQGLRLSASVGTAVVPTSGGKPQWDAALTYNRSFGDTAVAAAIAYAYPQAGSGQLSGSASVLLPGGLNATFAAAILSRTGQDQSYVYGKLGYIADLFAFGNTAISIDAYAGDNFNVDGSTSRSYGIQAVQNLDYWKTELYLGVRSYEYDEVLTAYSDGVGVLAGARMKF